MTSTPLSPPPGSVPLRWWSQAWRVVVVLVLGVAFWALSVVDDSTDLDAPMTEAAGGALFLDLVVGLACVGLLTWRRRAPLVVAVALGLAQGASSFACAPWLVSAVSVSTRRRVADIPVVVGTFAIGTLVYERTHPAAEPLPVGWLVGITILSVAVVTAIGWYIGARRDLVVSLRERAHTLEREHEVRLEAARANERAAIAREMHDVLAHRISLVAMHAGALTYRDDLDADRRRDVARTIETNAHLALDDLRDVLGVLRSGDSPVGADASSPGVTPPQPTLADVPALVQECRDAGVDVDLRQAVGGSPPATLGRHAYRIVQESLTNARKHAPGQPVTLRLEGSPGARLTIEVSNPTPAEAATAVPGAGAGLAGMTERAALAGGRLTHTRSHDGRFVVRADLPWKESEWS